MTSLFANAEYRDMLDSGVQALVAFVTISESPHRWTFDFAAFLDGKPVGAQGLSAVGFPVRHEVATGSWLGLRYQRQGFGREMRAAVLILAFGHLPLGSYPHA